MSETPKTLPGELAAEIARVSALREQYREIDRRGGVALNVKPGIHLMTISLERAIVAIDLADIGRQRVALADLRDFS